MECSVRLEMLSDVQIAYLCRPAKDKAKTADEIPAMNNITTSSESTTKEQAELMFEDAPEPAAYSFADEGLFFLKIFYLSSSDHKQCIIIIILGNVRAQQILREHSYAKM